jgi:uncharacterized membrane protein (UPF0127 family)
MRADPFPRWPWRVVVIAAICLAVLPPGAAAGACVPTTPEWEAMQAGLITLTRDDGTAVQVSVKLADDVRERAAGFQHICPETVNEAPILFVFSKPVRVMFHMQNVHAPLDIGFIDADGRVVDIQYMAVYTEQPHQKVNRYYRPPAPIAAALETRAGLFATLGVTAGKARIDFTTR